MKTLYLDIFSGISGDMLIGALIDLGVDAHKLEHEMEKLGLDGYHLHVRRGTKASIEGVKFDVHLAHDHEHHHGHGHDHEHEDGHEHHHEHGHEHGHEDEVEAEHAHEHTHADGTVHTHTHSHLHHEHHEHHHHGHEAEADEEAEEHPHGRNYAEIKQLISRSSLSSWVKEKALAVFHRIAVAEGKIHGLPPEQVHFHEVGAVDSIVDIVGACIGLEMLGKPRVLAGPVIEGTGWIKCAHGRFPIPAPATLAILGARGIAVSQCEEPHELVTPTGAALLAELAESFGPMRSLVAEKIGFGLGTRDNRTRPNVLRAVLGESANPPSSDFDATRGQVSSGSGHDWQTDTIAVLETNLDDINAEILGNFVEQVLAAGALDIFHTSIQMKKNRPGVLLTVLCAEADADRFSELILRETSTFGIRRYTAERRKLKREFTTVATPHGKVTVKLGRLDGRVVQAAPEYESCRKLAEETRVPLKEIYAAANKAIQSGL